MNESRRPKTPRHLLLGRLYALILEPVRVQVLVEFPLLTEAPRADLVLLLREGEQWSAPQRHWLADGLRHADEAHLLIEFKHSEGLNTKALQQLNAYDHFYREGRGLKAREVACFLVVASTPDRDWQGRFGFVPTEWPGVYRGTGKLLEQVRVLLLNELVPSPHNAPLKCFATQEKEREKAFTALHHSGFMRLSQVIERFTIGLWRMFMRHAPQVEELTPDDVMAMGKELIDALLAATPVEEILKHHGADEVLSHYKPAEVLSHYKPAEVLSHYKPEQRLAGLTNEQRLAGLTEQQRLAGLTEQQRLAGLTEQQRLAGLTEEQRLAGLTEEQILAYLERLRRSKN